MKSHSITPIQHLIEVVAKLRDPINGCPWDKKQNHHSLIPYAIEEAHEVADAIRNGNDENLCDELGDLLLQVVMHAQLAHESERFCFDDVAKAVTKKMIRRHPHVFDRNKNHKKTNIPKNWEIIKQSERDYSNSNTPVYEEIKRKLKSKSALQGSIYISKKMRENNIEPIDLKDTLKNLHINIKELTKEKINALDNKDKISNLIFTLVQISILLDFDIEESLIQNNTKKISQIKRIEQALNKNN